jgi:hypothetical protein|tara:strand:+ start:373 stop:591 length:219 start_codon:yes stop_codon:yes gene_type:complete
MSFPLGQSFRIEDIMKSEQGKYLTFRKLWWTNYEKLPNNFVIGGNKSNNFIGMSNLEPLKYDGIGNFSIYKK